VQQHQIQPPRPQLVPYCYQQHNHQPQQQPYGAWQQPLPLQYGMQQRGTQPVYVQGPVGGKGESRGGKGWGTHMM
jgi:hypothetical protein